MFSEKQVQLLLTNLNFTCRGRFNPRRKSYVLKHVEMKCPRRLVWEPLSSTLFLIDPALFKKTN